MTLREIMHIKEEIVVLLLSESRWEDRNHTRHFNRENLI